MHWNLNIDAGLKTPLYRQLADAMAEIIVDGQASEGDQLPSVRDLAVDLRINPNTVARAYRELESEGYVRSEPGKGVFVAFNSQERRSQLPPAVENVAQRLVEEALRAGVSGERLIAELRRLWLQSGRGEEKR